MLSVSIAKIAALERICRVGLDQPVTPARLTVDFSAADRRSSAMRLRAASNGGSWTPSTALIGACLLPESRAPRDEAPARSLTSRHRPYDPAFPSSLDAARPVTGKPDRVLSVCAGQANITDKLHSAGEASSSAAPVMLWDHAFRCCNARSVIESAGSNRGRPTV